MTKAARWTPTTRIDRRRRERDVVRLLFMNPAELPESGVGEQLPDSKGQTSRLAGGQLRHPAYRGIQRNSNNFADFSLSLCRIDIRGVPQLLSMHWDFQISST